MAGIPHDHDEPNSGGEKWLHKRLPILGLAYDTLMIPTPKNLNWMWIWGIVLVFTLVLQIITGIVLVMHYTPHVDMAFASIEHIMRDVNGGHMIRYFHMNGASLMFFAMYMHIFRSLYYGSYKAPREVTWIIGSLMMVLMMGIAFMGYVLPWGQMSFWGATVITGFFAVIPVVGESLQTLLLGGFAVDNATLNRFYSLHYLLPWMIAGVVILHIWALHVTGQTNPTGVEPKSKSDTVPFTPYATIKDALALIVFAAVWAYFVFFIPNYLGHADKYIPANALVTPSHIVPEWYFLPFYAILRAITFNIGPIDSAFGGVIAMFASIIVLFFIPWLDTSRVRSAAYRPLYKIAFWVFVANAIFLGWLGSRPAEGWYIPAMQVSTLYYFAFFLVVMPLLGIFEKPKELPNSITEAVLEANRGKKHGSTDMKPGGFGRPAGAPAAPEKD